MKEKRQEYTRAKTTAERQAVYQDKKRRHAKACADLIDATIFGITNALSRGVKDDALYNIASDILEYQKEFETSISYTTHGLIDKLNDLLTATSPIDEKDRYYEDGILKIL